MDIDIDIYNNSIFTRDKVSYDNCIDVNVATDVIKNMKGVDGVETCYYLISKLLSIVDFELCEIWSFKSETANIGDVKEISYPKGKKLKVKFREIAYLKKLKVPSITNNIKSDPRLAKRKILKSSKKYKKVASMPVKMITDTPTEKISVLTIPINIRGDRGIIILYQTVSNSDQGFKVVDVLQLMPYISLIQTVLPNINNFSGGMIRRTQEKDEMKDTFLATVSHELRTPLNGIVGMISMMRDAGPLTEKQSEYLVILMECSHQLMTMLNNMLDFNKMISKRIALLRVSFDIHQCSKDAVLMAQGKAKSKGLELKFEISKDIPQHLIGDPQRFIQILTNLLSNAIKFTEKGYVSLKIKGEKILVEDYVKKWKISIEVQDSGVGIPKEDQELIFNGFYQSQHLAKDMTQGGTGLGLSISRELITLMNGDIQVISTLGQGTIFEFFIIAEEEIRIDSLESADTLDVLKGSKVMIVDDRPEYRLQLTEILFKLDCIPTALSSGEEVLQYIKYGSVYDTIIVDICMPYMSGVELAQNLIQYEKEMKLPHTPLLALSSVELQGGKEIFDVYLNKPIDQNSLFPALMKCLRFKKSGTETNYIVKKDSPRQRKSKDKLKILIAEDDPNNSYTMKEMLTHLGFNQKRIKCVPNGQKCLEEAKKHNYDVILMDIIMPVMDGLEATKYIRLMANRPYIIAVSAAVQKSDRNRCQKAGIDGYLAKPVIKNTLEASLSHLIV